MSELGNETLTTMLGAGQKEIEVLAAILKKLFELLKYISEAKERRINLELKKAELNKVKQAQNIEEARSYLNNTRGLVKAKYMQNAGKDLYPLVQPMSPAELKRFNRLAKTYGLNYYTMQNEGAIEKYAEVKKELEGLKKQQQRGRDQLYDEYGDQLASLKNQYADLQAEIERKTVTTSNDREQLSNLDKEIKELENKMNKEILSPEQLVRKQQLEKELEFLEKERNDVIVVVFKDDLPIVENITNRMNTEIDLQNINREIAKIQSKIDLSPEDRRMLNDLVKQSEKILKGEFNRYGNVNTSDNVVYAHESYSFDNAINHTCDRDYATGPCYICDKNNPDNYIEVENQQDGNTSFTVYTNGQKLDKIYYRDAASNENQTSESRDQEWRNTKADMKEKGGFSDDLVLFSTKEDYLAYKEDCEKGRSATSQEYTQGKAGWGNDMQMPDYTTPEIGVDNPIENTNER